ncbi:hypothetical protein I0D68_11975 [Pseudomonas lalucatii]|nr:hypothetical protein [Pseudomonas lalucatii]QVM86575.1 hypothetical protein I0D68_11975 [Pseudomonas lalucatii]
MSQARFKIVFDGELMPEVTLETAKDNLARLFKSDRTRINSLFSGSPWRSSATCRRARPISTSRPCTAPAPGRARSPTRAPA